MWIQTLHASRRSADIPCPTSAYVDFRRRAASAGKAAQNARVGGTHRMARGVWEQAERNDRFAADAKGPVGSEG